ncbi:MAG: response regulator transcription factor [Bacillota bacterium]
MGSILIVEDDLYTRTNVIDLLNETGYIVYSAEDGIEGLTAAKKNLPDLVISDITMPQLNGIELFYALKKDPVTSTIPVIFLTSRSEPNEIKAGLDLGAEGYITKPFHMSDLLGAIEKGLNKARENRLAKLN